jgi:hypothetical protein
MIYTAFLVLFFKQGIQGRYVILDVEFVRMSQKIHLILFIKAIVKRLCGTYRMILGVYNKLCLRKTGCEGVN